MTGPKQFPKRWGYLNAVFVSILCFARGRRSIGYLTVFFPRKYCKQDSHGSAAGFGCALTLNFQTWEFGWQQRPQHELPLFFWAWMRSKENYCLNRYLVCAQIWFLQRFFVSDFHFQMGYVTVVLLVMGGRKRSEGGEEGTVVVGNPSSCDLVWGGHSGTRALRKSFFHLLAGFYAKN